MTDKDRPAVTEHATLYAGGSMLVWNERPHVVEIFPTADKIRAEQRTGAKVFRRRVVIVEDWTQLPKENPR